MDIANELGGKVSQELAIRGMTIQDLSDATDIPYTTLRRKVRGLAEFKNSELVRTAEVFGLRPSVFVPSVMREPVGA